MKITASAPLTWPGPLAIVEAWQSVAALTSDPRVLADTAGGDRWVLEAGSHGRPGARYRLQSPQLTRAAITGEIGSDPTGRTLALRLDPELGTPAEGELLLDGPDAPNAFTTSGRLGLLRWSGAGDTQTRRAHLTVALPWAEGVAHLRVVPASSGGERLDAEVGLRGRGLWRAPGALAARLPVAEAQGALQRFVDQAAGLLTRVAQGWRPGTIQWPAASEPIAWDAWLDPRWVDTPASAGAFLRSLRPGPADPPAPASTRAGTPAPPASASGTPWPTLGPGGRGSAAKASAPVTAQPTPRASTTKPRRSKTTPRRKHPLALIVGGTVAAGALVLPQLLAPRDQVNELRALPGVSWAFSSRYQPDLFKRAKMGYSITLTDDPSLETFEAVLAARRAMTGDSTPAWFSIAWQQQGRARSYSNYTEHSNATALDLAELPSEPRVVYVSETDDGDIRVAASCLPERLVADCVQTMRHLPHRLVAQEEDATGSWLPRRMVTFTQRDLDATASLFQTIREKVPNASEVDLEGPDAVASRAKPGRPDNPARFSLSVRWGPSTGDEGKVDEALATAELHASARAAAASKTPVRLIASINHFDHRASWITDECMQFSDVYPLNPDLYRAVHAQGRPVLEPPGCPKP